MLKNDLILDGLPSRQSPLGRPFRWLSIFTLLIVFAAGPACLSLHHSARNIPADLPVSWHRGERDALGLFHVEITNYYSMFGLYQWNKDSVEKTLRQYLKKKYAGNRKAVAIQKLNIKSKITTGDFILSGFGFFSPVLFLTTTVVEGEIVTEKQGKK